MNVTVMIVNVTVMIVNVTVMRTDHAMKPSAAEAECNGTGSKGVPWLALINTDLHLFLQGVSKLNRRDIGIVVTLIYIYLRNIDVTVTLTSSSL